MKDLIYLYAESFVKNMPKRQLKKFLMLNYHEQYKILDMAYTAFEKQIKKAFIDSAIKLIEESQKEVKE